MGLTTTGVGPSAGGGTGNDSVKFMQRGDAMGLQDKLSKELASKNVLFMMDGPKKVGNNWTVTLTVRNKNDVPPDLLNDKRDFYNGLKVNIQVDETMGLH